ncbi:hypothetical protein PQQ81_25225 [Paraburkholderia strydomiana]|uniref:hypothetical protein n=1 Tax=Paraburkholderia strydomiana TaxID=1245417 RepID=UPI0038B7ABF3
MKPSLPLPFLQRIRTKQKSSGTAAGAFSFEHIEVVRRVGKRPTQRRHLISRAV